MRSYILFIQYKNSKVEVTKELASDKAAKFWAELCLDICGKDENGELFIAASIRTVGGLVLRYYETVNGIRKQVTPIPPK